MAAVSLAMPTKLWDSAGRECGRTFLYLQSCNHVSPMLNNTVDADSSTLRFTSQGLNCSKRKGPMHWEVTTDTALASLYVSVCVFYFSGAEEERLGFLCWSRKHIVYDMYRGRSG